MAGNTHTRKYPTLTEIVEPSALIQTPLPAEPIQPEATEPQSASQEAGFSETQIEAVIRRLSPSLELELRRSAHALLDVQLTAILPDLHKQIEHLVRQAMEEGDASAKPQELSM